jgi:hypothetical protein
MAAQHTEHNAMSNTTHRTAMPVHAAVSRYVSCRKEHVLCVLDNRIIGKLFGPEREKVKGKETGEKCIKGSFVICIPPKILSA